MADRVRSRRRAAVAVVLLAAAAPLPAQTFDRFFTTAAERRLMDEAREDFQAPAPVAPVGVEQAEPEAARGPVVPAITVSGVVLRKGGRDTTWINGSRIRPDEVTPEGIRVRPSGETEPLVRIDLPDGSRPIRLRPGQRIDLETGAVVEVYERAPEAGRESVFDALAPEPDAPGASPAPEPASASGG